MLVLFGKRTFRYNSYSHNHSIIRKLHVLCYSLFLKLPVYYLIKVLPYDFESKNLSVVWEYINM